MSHHRSVSGNLLACLPEGIQAQELLEIILETEGVRVERIVSTGQFSPEGFWYDQPENEWLTVMQGEGTLTFEGGERVTLRTGDYYFIPAHCRHRVEATSTSPPCIWLAVFWLAPENPKSPTP